MDPSVTSDTAASESVSALNHLLLLLLFGFFLFLLWLFVLQSITEWISCYACKAKMWLRVKINLQSASSVLSWMSGWRRKKNAEKKKKEKRKRDPIASTDCHWSQVTRVRKAKVTSRSSYTRASKMRMGMTRWGWVWRRRRRRRRRWKRGWGWGWREDTVRQWD